MFASITRKGSGWYSLAITGTGWEFSKEFPTRTSAENFLTDTLGYADFVVKTSALDSLADSSDFDPELERMIRSNRAAGF